MATETLTELELFHRFVTQEIARGNKAMTPQQSVERFAAYLRDVEKLNKTLRPALEEAARGGGRTIDWDEFFREAESRLRAEGVPE